MTVRKSLVLFVAVALLIAFAPMVSAGQFNFPTAGQYTINSHPSFLITVGDSQEVVECDATLIVKAGEPYITANGTRRVDLTIVDWKADGKSTLIGGPLKFRMTQGVKTTDASFVETFGLAKAGAAADFPAQAQFAVPYSIDTPFGVVDGLFGVTRGAIKAFPPSGDIFMMEKGDIAKVMNALMPTPLSTMSASGDVDVASLTIQPLACACPVASDAPVDTAPAPVVRGTTGG